MTSQNSSFKINGKTLKNGDFYFIAEVGHNHQGDVKKAKEMFLVAKQCGASAVKLQKRDNKELYTKSFFNEKYENRNSFAETYGLHREALEFGVKEYEVLKKYANEIDIDFFATPFDLPSLEFLENLNMPLYKIASADLNNSILQTEIAKLKKPIILSTGGGTLDDVKRAINNITKFNDNIAILHCTASYPVDLSDMNLNVIKTYKNEFPNYTVGLSDHENGIDAATVAYMLGARVFEKHFTLNRANKGTDNAFSLEPAGLEKLIRNLKRIPKILGSYEKKILESEKAPLFKMQKSIVAAKNLKNGSILSKEDLVIKSPGGGLPPYKTNEIIGKKLKREIKFEEIILEKDVQ